LAVSDHVGDISAAAPKQRKVASAKGIVTGWIRRLYPSVRR
jgi:hypothetical protein